MKGLLTILVFFIAILLFSQCNNNSDAVSTNNKDLGQNMIDMMVYHDNLGTELRKGDAENASWLLEGMDSSLQVIAAKFIDHRKLTDPFKKTYQKKLEPAIKDIRNSLNEKNMPKAISAYRILTKNCNGCHINNEIDEVVLDLSDPSYN